MLAAAVETIRNGGISSATSRSIATAAGENLGSITYYFGSKDELVDEAMLLVATELIQPVLRVFGDPTKAPTEALFEAIPLMQQMLTDHSKQVPAYVQCLASAVVDPSIRPKVATLHRSLHTALADAITSHKEAGAVADWVDPTAMAQVIVAVAHGIAITSAIDDEAVDPTAASAQFVRLVLLANTEEHGS